MKMFSSRLSVVAVLIGSSLAVAGCSAASDNADSESSATTGVDPINVKAGVSVDVPGVLGSPLSAVATVTGHVTSQGPNLLNLGLAGNGAISAAATVQLVKLVAGGGLEVIAHAAIDPSGSFSIKLPLGIDVCIAQILDLTGHVIGSVVVGAHGAIAGGVIVTAPITAQTSLQAQVLLAALACPTVVYSPPKSDAGACSCDATKVPSVLPASLLALDVVAGIDVKLAAAITAAVSIDADAGASLDLLVHALAQATVSAARARLDALVHAGVALNLDAFAEAELKALVDLNVGLDAVFCGKASLDSVIADLQAAIEASIKAAGNVSVDVEVQAEVAASLTFAASLTASLAVDTTVQCDAVLFAAIHAVAVIEAKIIADAIIDLVKLTGAAQSVIDGITAGCVPFLASIASATDLPGLSTARANLVQLLAQILAPVPGLVGGLLTTVDGVVQGPVQSLLGTVGTLTSGLDADLKLKLAVLANVDICLDVGAFANVDVNVNAVLHVLAKVFADARALAIGPLATGSLVNANVSAIGALDAVADILSIAEVGLRVAP